MLWSLCNEEVFYLFFPLVCLLTRSVSRLVVVLGAFVVVEPFFRARATNEIWSDYGYLSCMGIIAIGCLSAIAADRIVIPLRLRIPIQWVGIFLISFITLYRGTFLREQIKRFVYRPGLDVPILAIGTGLLLIIYSQNPRRGSVAMAPLRWYGRNSYEIYLTHMFVIFTLLPFTLAFDSSGKWVPLTFGLMLLVAAGIGELVSRYFSEPANRRLRATFAVGQSSQK